MAMCNRTARVRRLLGGSVVAFVAFTPPASAQVLADTEVRTVEVIGLKRWTPEMIADSLARYAPGDSLHSHACAAALRYRLGFAEAASTLFRSGGQPYVLVSLVEPQDSARVRHRYVPMDTTTFRAEWVGMVDVIRTRPDLFILAVSRNGPGGISAEDRELPAHAVRDSALVHRVWEFLAGHRREEDFEASIHILATGDPALYNRMVAAAILSNFSDRDLSWWVLADALRESDGPVKATAGTVLASRAWAEPRLVDWGLRRPRSTRCSTEQACSSSAPSWPGCRKWARARNGARRSSAGEERWYLPTSRQRIRPPGTWPTGSSSA